MNNSFVKLMIRIFIFLKLVVIMLCANTMMLEGKLRRGMRYLFKYAFSSTSHIRKTMKKV
jgi:hypothetical protein